MKKLSKTASSEFSTPFFRLAIANILSNLMVPLAGLISTAFLGHLNEIHYLAGVSLATALFNVIYWSFGFLRMATTGMTAQAVGREDADAVVLVALRNGVIALVLGSLLVLLQVPLRDLGFAIFSATPDVKAAGTAFFDARIWGSPAVLLNMVLLGWFLGREQGQRVLVLSLIVNLSNVALDYGLIVRWGTASAGAGWAITLSQYLMLAVGLFYGYRDLTGQLTAQSLRSLLGQLFDLSALTGLFRLNRDILLRTFAVVISFALFTNLSAAMGTDVLAANTLLLQVITLSSYFIDGIAFATESFAGKFHGQGNRQALTMLLRQAGGISLGLGLAMAILFVIWPEGLFGLLTQHRVVIDLVKIYVGWLIPILGFGAIAFMLDGYFLGLTAGPILRNSTAIAALIGFLPLALWAGYHQAPHLLWLALACFMAVRALTLGWVVPTTLP